jgi:hypothetical protein
MILKMQIVKTAADLPGEWDGAVKDYFQTREFLTHTEKYNSCDQRYYTFYNDNSFAAGLVVYTLKLDLFTYSFIRCPLSMNIGGIPCSVSSSGFIGKLEFLVQVINQVKTKEKGFLVILNLAVRPEMQDVMIGNTLPTIIFDNEFRSWNSYIGSLKSEYRRRIKRSAEQFESIIKNRGDCTLFTKAMYKLYLAVLDHSKGKLETLSYNFFHQLPERFSLTAFHFEDNLLGWYISVSHENQFYFFLGGINYKLNDRFKTYSNLLQDLLEEGIRFNRPIIDLGQTAEISKIRLGGKIKEKWMVVHHSKWLFRKLLITSRKILEYSEKFPVNHVFKEKQ